MKNNNYQLSKEKPIVIAGMHRSGTSLVAHILSECGLFLGEDDQLIASHETDNVKGYWEFRSAVEYSDRLLKCAGSSWDTPEVFRANNWKESIDLIQETGQVKQLFYPLINSGNTWGWKDPRVTIMLPFWKSIFPNMKLIVCVRNPLEVAFSLSKRYVSHVDFYDSLKLWQEYYEALFNDNKGVDTIVTHYESLFFDAQKEIRRLCDFAGLKVRKSGIEKAAETINFDLYRILLPHKLIYDLSFVSDRVQEIYFDLCSLCGDQYQFLKSNTAYQNFRRKNYLVKMLYTSVESFDSFYHVITEKNELINKLTSLNSYYSDSKSWRYTRPLRKFMRFLNGKKNKW